MGIDLKRCSCLQNVFLLKIERRSFASPERWIVHNPCMGGSACVRASKDVRYAWLFLFLLEVTHIERLIPIIGLCGAAVRYLDKCFVLIMSFSWRRSLGIHCLMRSPYDEVHKYLLLRKASSRFWGGSEKHTVSFLKKSKPGISLYTLCTDMANQEEQKIIAAHPEILPLTNSHSQYPINQWQLPSPRYLLWGCWVWSPLC